MLTFSCDNLFSDITKNNTPPLYENGKPSVTEEKTVLFTGTVTAVMSADGAVPESISRLAAVPETSDDSDAENRSAMPTKPTSGISYTVTAETLEKVADGTNPAKTATGSVSGTTVSVPLTVGYTWKITVTMTHDGKDILTVQGEYSANMLREAILGIEVKTEEPAQVPARPPILCPGCPHRSTFTVLNELKIHGAGDIGCYTLGAVAPLNVIDTTVCMGSSISTLHGMEKAKGKEYIKNWVALIGDSTFLHTGINSLLNMVYNKSTGTVIIMDNSTTGMTGHQDHAATGKTLSGEATYAVDLVDLCHALGVEYVSVVNAFDTEKLKATIKEEVARDAVSVIISQAPCALLKTNVSHKKCYALSDKCKKCGMCLKPGCPALTKNPDGTIRIDETMCNGCGLCESRCKFGAIESREV